MLKYVATGFGAALALSAISTAANAAAVTYTIVPAQSSLTISGSLINSTATAQTTGSLTTTFTGSVAADRTASAIAFNEGSTLTAALQAVNQQPRSDATPGSQPANFGRTAELGSPYFVTAYEALRNVVLDVFDDTSGAGSTVGGGGAFSSGNLGLEFKTGDSDVLFGNGTNEIDLSGKGTSNGNTTASTVVVSGGIETLTLHFATGQIAYNVAGGSDSNLSFSGTIVATRVVTPEPTSIGLLAGGAMLALRRRR